MLMKTPHFEWEPEPRTPRNHRKKPALHTACAYVGIGISILVLYAFAMIYVLDWLTVQYVDAVRTYTTLH